MYNVNDTTHNMARFIRFDCLKILRQKSVYACFNFTLLIQNDLNHREIWSPKPDFMEKMLVSLVTISVAILSRVSYPQYWTTPTNLGLTEDVFGKKVPVTSDKLLNSPFQLPFVHS